ncbi:MAG TPA: peptidylprolyl isomerase [Alphaproteobacteria bacterium]|nr:peptidylprolyl isomerase [Alphaproteobacteria bacterium]
MPKRSYWMIAAVFVCAAALHADNIVDEIIARVDDHIITRADMEKESKTVQQELKETFPQDWESKWRERQKDLLRELIDQQLLLGKAKELGFTGDTEVIKKLNEMRQQMGLETMDDLEKAAQQQGISFQDLKEQIRGRIVVQQVIGKEVGSHVQGSITADQIKAFYDTHQKEMEAPEEIRLSEILISTKTTVPEIKDAKKDATPVQLADDPAKVAEAEAHAHQLLEELRKGADFAALAKKSSDGATAAQGGDLGSFKRGELDKNLEAVTFALKPGETTDVIRTRQGFIILKVVDHQAAGVPTLKAAEERIREVIYSEKLQPALRAYLTKLREEAYIDLKAGYVDTGASPNQPRPVMLAAANSGEPVRSTKAKKKKKFLVF